MSVSNHSRLSAYTTLAATAASASLAGVAEADTIVTDLAGLVINWNQTPTTLLDINMTGVGGIRFTSRATQFGGKSTWSFVGVVAKWDGGGSGKFQRTFYAFSKTALLANYGATANAGTQSSGPYANVNLGRSGSNYGNSAHSGTSRYLLFNFQANGDTHYGWIELLATTTGFSGDLSNYSATLGRWAYSTDAGYELAAGEIQASTPAVPGPTGLAALVFGAAGIRSSRSRH